LSVAAGAEAEGALEEVDAAWTSGTARRDRSSLQEK
jgi:hypothetical protein